MGLRRLIAAFAMVTFAVTSVICGCRPSFADPLHASTEGCHGGHDSTPSDSGAPHKHEKNCQHCDHAQVLETKDATKVVTPPVLQPFLLPAVASPVLAPRDTITARQLLPVSRAAPPPIYLLKQVFLI